MLTLFAPYQSLCATVNCNNSNVVVTASWALLNSLGLTPNTTTALVNSNAQFTIVAQNNQTQLVSFMSLVNEDSANTQLAQVILQTAVSSSVIYSAVLPPGYGLFYVNNFGFQLLDATGLVVPSVYSANASATANAAYGQANLAYAQANSAYAEANTANGQANLAYAQANAAYGQANSAYGQANSAYGQANSAYGQANSAYAEANAAYAKANSDGVYANGTVVQSNTSNLNFNNTATVNVSVSANGATQSNIAFTANVDAILASVASGNTSNINVTQEANGQVQIDTRLVASGGNGGGGGVYYSNNYISNANITLGALTQNTQYTYYSVPNVGIGLVTQLSIVANTVAADWDLVVRGGSNSNAQLYLAANGIAVNTYTITYPWYYTSQTASAGDQTMYIGIRNDLSTNTLFNVAFLEVVQFQANANIYANSVAQTAMLFEQFTATTNQSVFNLTNLPPGINYVDVTRNGLQQLPTLHFTLSGTTLTFTSNCVAGDQIGVQEAMASYVFALAAVAANGTLVNGGGNVNFNNTATVNVVASANGATQSNIAFNVLLNSANTDLLFNNNGNIAGTANIQYSNVNGLVITTPVTIDAGPGQEALYIGAANNEYGLQIAGNSNVGNSLGLYVGAGTNASDYCAQFVSANGACNYLTITGAGVSVNNVPFIPVWTKATIATGYNGNISPYNPVSYWVDPFGICHLKGLLEPNVNTTLASATSVNVANGFPVPANLTTFSVIAGNTQGTTGGIRALLWNNNALQLICTASPLGSTGNLNFVSLDGCSYNTLIAP